MPCSDLFSSSSKVRIGVSVSCACTGMSWIHDTVSTTEILCDRHQLEASLEEQFSLFNNLFNIGYVTAHLWCTMRKTMRRPRESSHMSLNTFLLSAKRKESRTTGKNAEMCNNQPYAFVIFGEIATTQRIFDKGIMIFILSICSWLSAALAANFSQLLERMDDTLSSDSEPFSGIKYSLL